MWRFSEEQNKESQGGNAEAATAGQGEKGREEEKHFGWRVAAKREPGTLGEWGSTAPRSSSEVRRKEGMKSRLDTGRLCAVLLICLCLSELGGIRAEQREGKCRAWTQVPTRLKLSSFRQQSLECVLLGTLSVGACVCVYVLGRGESASCRKHMKLIFRGCRCKQRS